MWKKLLNFRIFARPKAQQETKSNYHGSVVDDIPLDVKCLWICDLCSDYISEGDIRWCCALCHDLDICQTCHNDPSVPPHPHTLIPETLHVDTRFQQQRADVISVQDLIVLMCRQVPDRYALGTIVHSSDSSSPSKIEYTTFHQLGILVNKLAYALHHVCQFKAGEKVLICSANSPQWLVVDLACILAGLVVVPLHTVLSKALVDEVLATIAPVAVFCDDSTHHWFVDHDSVDDNRYHDAPTTTTGSQATYVVIALTAEAVSCSGACGNGNDIVDTEEEPVVSMLLPPWADHSFFSLLSMCQYFNDLAEDIFRPGDGISSARTDDSDLATIMFTSGSTGLPKGVTFSSSEWLHRILYMGFTKKYNRWFSMSPLSLASDRITSWSTLLAGGVVIFPSEDRNLLLSELRLAAPTSIAATPVFWTWRYESFELDYQRAIVERRVEGYSVETDNDVRQELLKEYAVELGPFIQSVITGGAPTPAATLQFMHDCYGTANIGVHESFGTTETGAVTVDGSVPRGVDVFLRPLGDVQIQLPSGVDEEDLEIGEILVKKSKHEMTTGYYANAKETDDHFLNGFYCTGDIGCRLANGEIRIVDRIKNVFKLAQGEFVVPQKIEDVLLSCPLVDHVFVTGNTTERQVVAIVVLSAEYQTEKASAIVNSSDLIQAFRDIGLKEGLAMFETPVAVYIEKDLSWTQEKRFLTSIDKFQRQAMNAYYAPVITSMYERLSQAPVDIVSKIILFLKGTNNDYDHNNDENNLEAEWTGAEVVGNLLPDSVSLIQLSHRIDVEFHIKMKFDVLLSQSTTLNILQLQVRGVASDAAELLPNTDVLQSISFWENECELSLEQSDSTLTSIEDIALSRCDSEEIVTNDGDVVLLTGATGFLGPYLLHQLVQRYQVVICLVRGANDTDASLRVHELLRTRSLFLDDNITSRIEIWASDLTLENFGLSHIKMKRLKEEVDVIFHSAAHVSSISSYHDLRQANVESTKFLIQLAFCKERRKRFHFVSSTSALFQMS